MATSTIASHLRRRSRLLPSLSSASFTLSPPITSSHLINPASPPPPPPPPPPLSPTPYHRLHYPPQPHLNSFAPFSLLHSHSYSTRSSSDDSVYGKLGFDDDSVAAESDVLSLGFDGGSETLVDEVISGSGIESILPVRALISLIDGYHDFTGWPWWVVIASSTLALRIAILPVLILQLQKSKRIAELFPKLPPPLPPPLSGRSYIDQLSLFQKERRAIGCPSYLWFLATISVQLPCFLLLMTSIRRMSLDNHPGFDCGGTLWFQNLTEIPHGVVGLVFPLLIGSLHLINVQISFLGTSVGKDTGVIGWLAKCYKTYLYLMTVPIFFTGICIPQGSLVYWLTNSSLTMIQQLSLKHPAVQEKLGLPGKGASVTAASSEKLDTLGTRSLDTPTQQRQISIKNLSPQELLAVSVKYLSDGHKDKAIPLLRLALDKDPDYVRALIVMGQILLQKGLLAEATEYLEQAISKLYLVGHFTEVEDCDLLILASQWAGVAYIRQNLKAEGIVHLERIAGLEEPKDSKSKAHYFDGLLLLASALYNEGRKDDALNHLRRAAAYDSSYNMYLEQCEKDEEDFANDLASSRRGDY